MKKLLLIAIIASLSMAVKAQNFQHLKLTSMCSDDPTLVLRWRVKNLNSYPVTYTWKIVDGGVNSPSSSQYNTPFIAEPGDNYFFSPKAATGNNVMVIYVNNVEQNGGRKAAGKQVCPKKNFEVFVSCKKQVDACTYQVTFGYINDNPNTIFTIPHGQNNKFTGGSIIRGESDTVFYPGVHNDAFKIRIACGTNIVWHLKGPFGPKSVNSTAPYVNQCISSVKPYVNCITPHATKPGVLVASFGYDNTDSDTIDIACGADNTFNGASSGHPVSRFLPGKHDNAVTAEFTGTFMEWHLKDYTSNEYNVKAYNEYAGMCVEPVKPHVNCITHNKDESITAYFSYENFNSSTQTILKGNRNYMVGESGAVSLPETFSQGYEEDVFSATFTGKELKWILVGPDGVTRYAIASDEYCRLCDDKDKKNEERYIYSTFPNPSTDGFSLNVNTRKTDGKNFIVQVCDAFGKIKYSNEFTSGSATVQISLKNLPGGVYAVNLFCNEEKETIKILKQ